MNTFPRSFPTCLFAFFLASALADAQTMLHDVAAPRSPYAGAPRYGDVIMRSMYAFYGTNTGVSAYARQSYPNGSVLIDVQKAVDAGKAFHITRVDWSYIADHAPAANPTLIIQTLKNQTWKFGGALNTATFDANHALKDRSGTARQPPFYAAGRYTGCVNNPYFRAEFAAERDVVLGFSPDSLQVDDPEAGYFTRRWINPLTGLLFPASEHGCFCAYCSDKADDLNIDIWNDSDAMLAFQEDSVMEFYEECLEPQIGTMPLSTNGEEVTNISGPPFDYNMSERTLWGAHRAIIYWDVARKMEAAGSSLVYTAQNDLTLIDPPSGQPPVNLANGWRYNIGLAYANGINFIVPWDQFLAPNPGQRYWATPQDLADSYGFVRANAHFLNGYEDAVITGFGGFTTMSSNINTTTWQMIEARYGGSEDPLQINNDGASLRVSGFGRAVPGDATAPKVVHLVEYWMTGTVPNTHQIRLRVPNYFPVSTTVDEAITVRLHRPRRVYDQAAHDLAELSKNYAALTEVIPLTVTPEGGGTVSALVSISGTASGISPWGFLVVEKGGIQGHWSFDQNTSDYSPHSLALTLMGGGYSSLSCYSTNSLFLDGVDDYATRADDARHDMGTGDFSFSAWFYRESSATTNLRLLSKGGSSNTDAGYALWGSDTLISASVSNGATRLILTGTHNGINKWTHVAVNVNRTTSPYTMELFVDGVSKSSTSTASLSTVNINSAKALDIGRDASGLYWKGRVDDVRIYNRTLSLSEIHLLARKSL